MTAQPLSCTKRVSLQYAAQKDRHIGCWLIFRLPSGKRHISSHEKLSFKQSVHTAALSSETRNSIASAATVLAVSSNSRPGSCKSALFKL